MKTLYLIGGTMGVGKTTICRELQKKLPNCAFLDGDWCWDMRPFVVNDETKALVMDNICHVLNNFLRCSWFENVLFCWVMHQQEILEDILSRLDVTDWEVKAISLTCTEKALSERLQRDIDRGIREADVLERSISRLPLYDVLDTVKIDTTGKTVEKVAMLVIQAEKTGKKNI